MRRISVILGLILLSTGLFYSFCFSQETITITTYYPAPYGVYRELRSQRMALGGQGADAYWDNAVWPWCDGAPCFPGEIDENADLVVEGNVGIGTTNPRMNLQVGDDLGIGIASASLVGIGSSAGISGVHLGEDANNKAAMLWNNTDNYLRFDTTSSMTSYVNTLVLRDGNVGIGTTNPIIDLAIGDTDTGLKQVGDNKLAILTNNAERIRIDDNGNVGIGTIPGIKLDVKGTSALGRIARFYSTQNFGYIMINNANTGSGVTNGLMIGVNSAKKAIFNNYEGENMVFEIRSMPKMVIQPDGKIGIGGNPSHKLHVYGNTRKTSAGGDWDQSSDSRLKKNILPIKNALDTVMKLEGVTYMWKDSSKHNDEDGKYMGFTAQDVEKIIPEWIKSGSDGYKLLNAIGANALLVEAIKELKNRNEVLEQRIEALEAKLSNKSMR